jgi:hypothetical protein
MKKNHAARWITLGILASALGFVVWRKDPPPAANGSAVGGSPTGSSEQDAVYAMFDAAKDGRIDAYLSAYTGAVRASIEQTVKEQGREKFAAYLREQTVAVKGLALQDPQKVTDTQTRLQVDYIYQDRTETQALTLDFIAGAWRISRIEAAQRVRTLVPYGTPVY